MRDRNSFGEILQNLEAPRRGEAPGRPFANPLSTAAAPISSDAGDNPGLENLWDHAFAWAVDRAPEAPPPEPPPTVRPIPVPSDDPETIAAELGLTRALTRDELRRARRWFMWRNHPDRSPEIPPELANRRVAIANMLIDRALARLAKGGR